MKRKRKEKKIRKKKKKEKKERKTHVPKAHFVEHEKVENLKQKKRLPE